MCDRDRVDPSEKRIAGFEFEGCLRQEWLQTPIQVREHQSSKWVYRTPEHDGLDPSGMNLS